MISFSALYIFTAFMFLVAYLEDASKKGDTLLKVPIFNGLMLCLFWLPLGIVATLTIICEHTSDYTKNFINGKSLNKVLNYFDTYRKGSPNIYYFIYDDETKNDNVKIVRYLDSGKEAISAFLKKNPTVKRLITVDLQHAYKVPIEAFKDKGVL